MCDYLQVLMRIPDSLKEAFPHYSLAPGRVPVDKAEISNGFELQALRQAAN